MGLTSDQERIKTLLTETITLLCKNGLHFRSEFSIEGLLGITLDQENVFLISIKETIRTESPVVRLHAASKASNTAIVVSEVQTSKTDGGVRQQQPHYSAVAAVDSRCVSEDDAGERRSVVSTVPPLCKEAEGSMSKRLAGRKRRLSRSRSSSCSEFSVERDHGVQVVEGHENCLSDIDCKNNFNSSHQTDVKQCLRDESCLRQGVSSMAPSGKQSRLHSDNNTGQEVGNTCNDGSADNSSFDVINIKEESDDETESSVLSAQTSFVGNYQHSDSRKNQTSANREEYGQFFGSQTGCSSWNSGQNQSASFTSHQVINLLPFSVFKFALMSDYYLHVC
jgi:hypothetical protein